MTKADFLAHTETLRLIELARKLDRQRSYYHLPGAWGHAVHGCDCQVHEVQIYPHEIWNEISSRDTDDLEAQRALRQRSAQQSGSYRRS